jgi:hypothetical protein
MKNRPARIRRALFVLSALSLLVAAAGAVAQDEPTPAPDSTIAPTPGDNNRPGEGRFGVIESFEDPAAADRLGAAWTRVRFQWADVQPGGPEDWEPPIDDDELSAELDAGREVVGLLIGIPEWARDRQGLPRGLSLPPDHPDNTWAIFVRGVVSSYAGRIDRWIIWNEPDIDDPRAPGHTWDGSVEDFFRLQRTAYVMAKAANPDALIHLGAFTYFWDPGYFDRFLDAVAVDPQAAANNYTSTSPPPISIFNRMPSTTCSTPFAVSWTLMGWPNPSGWWRPTRRRWTIPTGKLPTGRCPSRWTNRRLLSPRSSRSRWPPGPSASPSIS